MAICTARPARVGLAGHSTGLGRRRVTIAGIDGATVHLLQAGPTIVSAFLPPTAVIFYLAVSIFFIVDPLRHMRVRARRPAGAEGKAADC